MQQTSLFAYDSIKSELGARQKLVLSVIRDKGPISNLEIAGWLNLPINQVTPRVLELRERELVDEAYKETSHITGRLAICWRARV